ncbi:hypothetical protein JCM15519_20840 [Fundidesulfovibrio butyratiphilus]
MRQLVRSAIQVMVRYGYSVTLYGYLFGEVLDCFLENLMKELVPVQISIVRKTAKLLQQPFALDVLHV